GDGGDAGVESHTSRPETDRILRTLADRGGDELGDRQGDGREHGCVSLLGFRQRFQSSWLNSLLSRAGIPPRSMWWFTRIEAGLSVLLRPTGENFGERTVNDIVLVLRKGRIRQQAHARADGVT